MPNVVTPFLRKRSASAHQSAPAPRHRREGWFDEQDQWHDGTPQAAATERAAGA